MSQFDISVERLSKRYRIGLKEEANDTLGGAVLDLMRRPVRNFRRLRSLSTFKGKPDQDTDDTIWALRDVSFQVKQGEIVGIIGANGAGKSTLLKVLSRITEPTSGRVVIRGRVSSLLEVGTGFHPELTGRENIYLNGTILGMTRREINRKFDEIVDFSGVEKFIDTPVKRYSSGMKVRLAFAVAAHLEPEVLIIDEVLAVGDAAFQRKCLDKLGEVGREGRTVLFVSHNMGAIRNLCRRCIMLADGILTEDGDPDQVLSLYLSNYSLLKEVDGEVCWSTDEEAPRSEEVALRSIRLLGPAGSVQSVFDVETPITIEITYEVKQVIRGMRVILTIVTQEGITAFASTNHLQQGANITPGFYKTACVIPGCILNLGRYYVKVHAGIPGVKILVPGREFLSFTTVGGGNHGSYFPETWPGVIAPRLKWQVAQEVWKTKAKR